MLFNIFKISIYTCIIITSCLFLIIKPTFSAFIESAGWLALLGLLEYKSTAAKWKHRNSLFLLTIISYCIICFGLFGYIQEKQWIDTINCISWLLICLILSIELYLINNRPELNIFEHRNIYYFIFALKNLLYAIIIICAILWSRQSTSFIDAIDAWLWLVCFFVIEANIMHSNHSKIIKN
jgi:uncharacterized membrane protein YbjE (DUF340 family)